MDAIRIDALTRCFGSRRAVDGLNLTVGEGELFALLGQNGAGKTTTIRMLCGLLTPTSGDALLMGRSVVTDTQAVKQLINVSPQETAVAARLTVRENLEFVAGVYGFDRRAARAKAQEMMETFSLTDRAKDRAKTLSGGMQRRLSIAMALISKPKILFLDEPTLGLDVRARRELWKHIGTLKGTMTIVLTTHYLEEAEALADRIAIMSAGKLAALGTAEQIRESVGAATLEDAFLTLTEAEEVEQ
ncbi:MAG: ABC transporter ATP-binding protein [Ruminococcaceae bacterium]|nr:ABC transporter ATP-binding protein [Oscillospiraceae bacterium]